MPEFSAGAIWVEVDGKRLDEFGEKEKLISKEAEAKSCFVELPDALSTCKVKFNYQPAPLNPDGKRVEALRFACSVLCESSDAGKSDHTITQGYDDLFCPMNVRGGPSHVVKPFEGLNTGLRAMLAKASYSPCLIKIVVSPRLLRTTSLSRCSPPPDPWEPSTREDQLREWWGIAGADGTLVYTHFEPKHQPDHIGSSYPQLSAIFQLSLPDMPLAPSRLNPSGGAVMVQDLPKTIFHRVGHPPALPPPTYKEPLSNLGACVGASTNQQRSEPAAKESGVLSRYRQENSRLAELLADEKAKVRRLEAERADEGALSSSGVKKRRIEVAAGEEIQIVGAAVEMAELKEEKKEDDEKEEKVKIKKEPGEDEA